MNVKKRCLPYGWYPYDAPSVMTMLDTWDSEQGTDSLEPAALACVAPHAGWAYSGSLAWRAWKQAVSADTVVILGGHLPAASPFVVARNDAYESPLGIIEANKELMAQLDARLNTVDELWVDNTVEVHLPMLKARFPHAQALWTRVPNDASSASLGLELAAWAQTSGTKLFVLASTDLCHYGPNYEWEPAGSGSTGRAWAAATDRQMADACTALDAPTALRLAEQKRAACSVGAVVAAMAYVKAMTGGKAQGRLLGLSSSLEHAQGSSFVGYGAIGYY